MKKLLLSLVFLAVSFQAHAIILTDTVSLGPIGDVDSTPGVPFTFNLGSALSSISSVTFTFAPCTACTDTIGTAENIVLNLGPDSFTIGNAGYGATVTAPLTFSSALAADLMDGSVSGLIWMQKQPGNTTFAAVSSADISLQVDGTQGGTGGGGGGGNGGGGSKPCNIPGHWGHREHEDDWEHHKHRDDWEDQDHHRVPEPGSLVLLGVGLFGIAFTRRRAKD